MKYLNIVNGAVADVFDSPQNADDWPGLIEVEDTDERYVSFIASTQPDPAQIAAGIRDSLLAAAAIRIAPLQDAVDLDEATADDIARLKKWKQYRVALNRLDLTADPITWPEQPA